MSLWACCLAGCHSYEPLPVDLDAHLLAFRRRLPALPADRGLLRDQARELAKVLHPDARLARRRAGVATARRDEAGRWIDPQLQTNLQRILEAVPYRWIATAQLGFTVPINGRLQQERELADSVRDAALVEAWWIEQQVANAVDRAWIARTAAHRRALLFEQTCDNLARLEGIALRLVAAGSLTRPGARIFTLEKDQREAGRRLARADARAADLTVKLRTGLHPDAEVAFATDMSIAPFVASADGRRRALRHSPRLLLRELEHAAAEQDLDLQVRRQYPDLVLWPGWQEEDAQPRGAFGINLSLPIWNRNEPEIARAGAERERTAEAVRAGFELLLQELAIAEVRRDAAAEQARRFDALRGLAEEQVADSDRLAEAGQFDPLLLLDALLRLHNVQMQWIDAEEDAALATVTINELLTDPASAPPVANRGDDR